MNAYGQRRSRVCAAIGDGIAVIPSARIVYRNNDTEYDFRQNSDFYYLTGFDEPDAVLVLRPRGSEAAATLFLRERDPEQERWNGKRLGVEAACGVLGVDRARPIDEFEACLPEMMAGADALWYGLGHDDAMDRAMREALLTVQARTRRRGGSPSMIADPSSILHPMRAIKEPGEVAALRRSAAATARGHRAAMRETRSHPRESDLAALLEYEFHRGGAQRLAYSSIVAGGENATVLHYRAGRDPLTDGSLVLADAAAEVDYYATDVTRTWPVSGRFSPEQRALYDVVLAAQRDAIAAVQPGMPVSAFHEAAVRTITEGLIDLGLLEGAIDWNIETQTYRNYFMHGTGHWLGMDVHDVGAYRDAQDRPVVLQPGMVTTVEPGIYVNCNAQCDERFKGIGIRIEDDILVTHDGHENLTADIPKEVEAIEALIGG